jgi:hypothetical protein
MRLARHGSMQLRIDGRRGESPDGRGFTAVVPTAVERRA